MKYPIKKVLFQEEVREAYFKGNATSPAILFKANKWYDVQYENAYGIIYLFSETKEKIAVATEEFKGKMLIQR